MNKNLKDIITLANIYNEIEAFEPEIIKIKTKYTDLLNQKNRLTSRKEKLNEEINDLSIDIKNSNENIFEIDNKLKDNATKIKNIQSDKELRSIHLENDIAKEQLEFLNSKIVKMENIKEKKDEERNSLTDEFTQIEEDMNKESSIYETAIKDVDNKKSILFEKKHKLAIKMDTRTLEFYEKIKRWAGNTTLVDIKYDACNGCFIKLQNNMLIKIKSNDEIINCPNCDRILYYSENEK